MIQRTSNFASILVVSAALVACSESSPQATDYPQSGVESLNKRVSPASNDTEDEQPQRAAYSAYELTDPPTYQGYNPETNRCDLRYSMKVVAPPDAGKEKRYPLFLYFTGTRFCRCDPSGYDNTAAMAVLKAMASGDASSADPAKTPYYAISVDYYNLGLGHVGENISCIYGKSSANALTNPDANIFSVACSLDGVDCSKIAVWGFSQGAAIAVWAHNYNTTVSPVHEVKTAWLTGYSPAGTTVPSIHPDCMRIVNGSNDSANAVVSTLNNFTGLGCRNTYNCLNTKNKGGWYLIQPGDLQSNYAGHCWFDHNDVDCMNYALEPAWLQSDNQKEFSLAANVEWLKRRVAGEKCPSR